MESASAGDEEPWSGQPTSTVAPLGLLFCTASSQSAARQKKALDAKELKLRKQRGPGCETMKSTQTSGSVVSVGSTALGLVRLFVFI